MPIQEAPPGTAGILQTVLSGRVTDEELLAYYAEMIPREAPRPWREVVDGTRIDEMAITLEGHARLAVFIAGHLERLRGGRVAMVAGSDVTYGMFRMWELQRERLGYEVRVFRRLDEAFAWVSDHARGESA